MPKKSKTLTQAEYQEKVNGILDDQTEILQNLVKAMNDLVAGAPQMANFIKRNENQITAILRRVKNLENKS